MIAPNRLNALRAFEASARHQSFAGAAQELNVTPAAVGQLVRTLEQWLGTPLFHRGSTGKVRLVMTETAERALPDIRAGFERLMIGVEKMREQSPNGLLTVTISPAFAAKWLLPRIERFHATWPDTDVRLDTQLKAVDFLADRVDIGVRYGAGTWAGLTAVKLMEEEIYPVCSPRLASGVAAMTQPCDLLKHTLIHDMSMDASAGFTTWDNWLGSCGVSGAATQRGMKINNSAAVLQAAIEGQGIALARSVMARDDIASGRLIRLFPDIQVMSPLSYFVVYRSECADQVRVKAFRDWLIQEAQAVTGEK